MLETTARCEECRGTHFVLRVMKDEGVACASCVGCSRDYLLLDSEDYWFDLIQERYPRPSRCPCKGEAFGLRFQYAFREGGDVESVVVSSTCAACGKLKKQMTVDIDYGGTEHLTERPLVFCKNPKIFYDLRRLSLYAAKNDIARLATFLAEQGCVFTCWLRRGDDWVGQSAERRVIEEAILNDQHRTVYASLDPVDPHDPAFEFSRAEDAFWKRHEVLRISSPTTILFGASDGLPDRRGFLYYIDYSNEFVKDDTVVAKSARFRELTGKLESRLGERFVSWRGRRCFDDEQEHLRLFGERFRARCQGATKQ
jgi:hypothetical protein